MVRPSAPEKTTAAANQSTLERRIGKRQACDGFAEVVVPNKPSLYRGKIANLSEFGCHVKTRAQLTILVSTEVELRFSVNGDNFSVLARAVTVETGVGVRFEFSVVEPQMYHKLLKLIEMRTSREAS